MKAHTISRFYPFCPLMIAGLLVLPSAQADDLSDWLKFDGFGTVGSFKANDAVAGLRADSRQSTYSLDKWRFDGDTQASIQATLNPNGKLKAVLQLISKKDINSSSKPTVEWAYLSYPVTTEFDFKLGRTVAPVFMMSDYRNVAYSQTTVRPQNEVYAINPITFQDGVTGRWEKKFDFGQLAVEGFFGKTTVSVALGSVDVQRTKGLSLRWTDGTWIARVGYSTNTLSFASASVSATLKSLTSLPAVVCSNCAAVIPAIAPLIGIEAKLKTVGFSYDDGVWIGQFEYAKRQSTSIIVAPVSGWNVLAGYRIGDFTPFVGAGSLQVDSAEPGLIAGPGAPAAFKAQLKYLNAARIAIGSPDRDAYAMGVRWDFAKNLAFKAQFDHIKMAKPAVGSTGIITYPTSMLGKPSGFDGRVSMLTLNLDFVF